MLEHFTEEEIERMDEFGKTPAYRRDPTQLLPEGADEPRDD